MKRSPSGVSLAVAILLLAGGCASSLGWMGKSHPWIGASVDAVRDQLVANGYHCSYFGQVELECVLWTVATAGQRPPVPNIYIVFDLTTRKITEVEAPSVE